MKVLGLTNKFTRFGKNLKDGGCCIITDSGEVVAVSEERISRKKYDGGYELAFKHINKKNTKIPDEITIAASSTCCEPEIVTPINGVTQNICVNHHLSHATLAYRTSLFNSALVVVIDGGGNVLEHMKNDNWWEHKREQHSYYSYSNGKLELIDTDLVEPYAYGLGEFWRSLTYACGFTSGTYAAKVMELAGMGGSLSLESPYSISDGKIETDLLYEPSNPITPICNILSKDSGANNTLPSSKLGDHIKLAAWGQHILEQIVIAKLRILQKRTGHKNVCLGGGVFLNCKLVTAISDSQIFQNTHVSFAPSDKGQCIGNALVAADKIGIIDNEFRITSPYIGTNIKISSVDIRRHLDGRNNYLFRENVGSKPVAKAISDGAIISIFDGNSEFGARALGARSIIASAFIPENRANLNKIKGRESYTPVAPVVLESKVKEYFINKYSSPYMERVLYRRDEPICKKDYSAATHQDGSARTQTIDDNTTIFIAKLLKELPGSIALNTSFNGTGRAIVEVPEDAIDEFFNLKLDAMLINGSLIWKKSARFDASIAQNSDEGWLFFYKPELECSDNTFRQNIERCLGVFFFQNVDKRERFSLYDNYINWLEEGRKVTTIRFVENGISIPSRQVFSLVPTKTFKQGSMDFENKKVKVVGFGIKKFKDLNIIDAKRDGFGNTSQLKTMLRRIYPIMMDDSYVSVNFIEQVH